METTDDHERDAWGFTQAEHRELHALWDKLGNDTGCRVFEAVRRVCETSRVDRVFLERLRELAATTERP